MRLLLILVSVLLNFEQTFSYEIHVSGTRGDDKKCHQSGSATPCKSLEQSNILLKRYGNDVTLILEGNLTLHSVFEVTNSTNIKIMGDTGRSSLVNCTSGNGGFLVNNVSNFTFSRIAVANCTAIAMLPDNADISPQSFAMLIYYSGNISLANITFQNCPHTALALVNNREHVSIQNSSFHNNSKFDHRKWNYANVTYPAALSISLNSSSKVNYTIAECTFYHNESPKTLSEPVYDKDNPLSYFINRGYGGGLYVQFVGNTKHSAVVVQKCSFVQNTATRGGAVYAYFNDDACNNTFHIIDSNFTDNHADISGGGVNVGYYNVPSLQNSIVIKSCNFTKNSGLYGGALAIFSHYDKEDALNDLIHIQDSIWCKNSGVLSSAVDVAPLFKEIENEGFLPVPTFMNCAFDSNYIDNTPHTGNKTYHINTGVFSVTKFRVVFKSTVKFKSNNFSAIVLVSGIAEFESGSVVLFHNNLGFNGGAIAMYSFSTVVFNPYSHINFSKNHAINSGGAIYYRTSDQHNFLRGASQCFLRNRNQTLANSTKVIFDRNTAGISGQAIYSESFLECYTRCYSHYKTTTFSESEVFDCMGEFSYDGDTRQMTSSAKEFKFTSKLPVSFEAFPGQAITLPFYITDDFGNVVHPLMSISNVSDHTIRAVNPYTVENTTYFQGESEAQSKFSISVIGVRQIYFYFNVTMLQCPPGFHNVNDSCSCATGHDGYEVITKCNDKFHAKYRNSLWFGYIPDNATSHKDLYYAPCASPLCNETNHKLPKHKEKLSSKVCSYNREGLMCGTCKAQHSTFFHSRNFTCGSNEHCHLGPLFYVLAELIPTVAFFFFVITFELSFTSGKMVGFIFFTQYLNQLTIHINAVFSHLRAPYRIFYGLFNFEFFNIEQLSFCIWKGAEVLDVIALKYVTVVLALMLVLIFIWLMNNHRCPTLCRLRGKVSTRTSVVHGLSAFLVTCYAQCTRTSFYILKYAQPVGYNNTLEKYYSYYGGLPFFGKQHLIYAVPALFSLLFVTILPPLVLLLYPLSLHLLSLCGLSEHWLVNKTLRLTAINKLKPFIDCFQSCYKDRLRFFAGLYFVYRVIILLVFSMSPDSFHFSVYSEILLVALLSIHSLFQPYKEKLHNTLDSLIFSNLALINGCVTVSKLLDNQRNPDDNNVGDNISSSIYAVSAIQMIFLYLPLLTLLFELGRLGYLHFPKHSSCLKKKVMIINVRDILEDDSNRSSIIDSKSSDDNFKTPSYGSLEVTY